ncbi:MAG: YeeE/YedE family protein [Rhodobacteraceae bacterium]|nr:YeeE/YedE family protein [Paracoccaceae bacterium]
MAISTYMALGGPTAWLRNDLFPPEVAVGAPQGLAHLIGNSLGLSPVIPALGIAVILLVLAFSAGKFRRSRNQILGGVLVGAAITSGWWFTTYLSSHSFSVIPVESHTFTAPLGESLFYVMTSTGSSLNFGIGSVVGVVVGAFIGALLKKRFRWEACDDHRELRRQILGAFLVGTGGVIALGCSVGQGLTAMSALAYSAPIVLISIYAGTALGLRQLIRGFNAS